MSLAIAFSLGLAALYFIFPMIPKSSASDVIDDQALAKSLKELRSVAHPPLPQGAHNIPDKYLSGFIHGATRQAIEVIKKAAPRQYHFFIPYASDESYCYSIVTSIWTNVTVSQYIKKYFDEKYKNPRLFNNGKYIETLDKHSFLSMIVENGPDWTREHFIDASEMEAEKIYRSWIERKSQGVQ